MRKLLLVTYGILVFVLYVIDFIPLEFKKILFAAWVVLFLVVFILDFIPIVIDFMPSRADKKNNKEQ